MSPAPSVDLVAVLVTAPDQVVAERLGRAVVAERLAACVNVVPAVTSMFRWEGEVRSESEALMILKTTSAGVDALRDRMIELHPYEVPEFLAFDVVVALEPYAAWVSAEVGPKT